MTIPSRLDDSEIAHVVGASPMAHVLADPPHEFADEMRVGLNPHQVEGPCAVTCAGQVQ